MPAEEIMTVEHSEEHSPNPSKEAGSNGSVGANAIPVVGDSKKL